MLETEIKYTVPDTATLEAVASLEAIGAFDVVEVGENPHTDTYFDTADRDLVKGKAVLRLRCRESGNMLTFKAQAGESKPKDGIHRRNEIECVWNGDADSVLAGDAAGTAPFKALADRFGGCDLGIVMIAVNSRRVFHLERENEAVFEMVFDDVTFEGPGGRRRILELEVESLGGSDDDLETIGALLTERYPLSPAGPSKYILGMELVGDGIMRDQS